jgi:hypothetical protein
MRERHKDEQELLRQLETGLDEAMQTVMELLDRHDRV